ncbi:transposase [Streptomyces cinnamoneus]|uniref:transposase n=1 Tax=Streptomyces cinnamoneus TaxID=53446 RepID=UPI003420D1A6
MCAQPRNKAGNGHARHLPTPAQPHPAPTSGDQVDRVAWSGGRRAVRGGGFRQAETSADVAAVTTVQIREVVERLVAAGQWRSGDPEVLVVLDAGYDAPRIAHLLDELPVEMLVRLRSDRVMRRPAPSREEFSLANPKGGRPPQARRRVRLRRPHNLGHRASRDGHGHPALWEGDCAGVGPAAPR